MELLHWSESLTSTATLARVGQVGFTSGSITIRFALTLRTHNFFYRFFAAKIVGRRDNPTRKQCEPQCRGYEVARHLVQTWLSYQLLTLGDYWAYYAAGLYSISDSLS